MQKTEHNPADEFVNRPGYWTPDIERQQRLGFALKCKHCGEGYNQHYPWPQLPCTAVQPVNFLTIIKDALNLAVRNTNTRLYLLPVSGHETERFALVTENQAYADALEALNGLLRASIEL